MIIDHESTAAFSLPLRKMKVFEQRKYLNAVITSLSKQYLNTMVDGKEFTSERSSLIGGVATLLVELIGDSDTLKEHLVTSLTKSTLTALDDYLDARRSVVTALAEDEGESAYVNRHIPDAELL